MHDGNARLGIRSRRRETREGGEERISRDRRENDPMSASAGFFARGARFISSIENHVKLNSSLMDGLCEQSRAHIFRRTLFTMDGHCR